MAPISMQGPTEGIHDIERVGDSEYAAAIRDGERAENSFSPGKDVSDAIERDKLAFNAGIFKYGPDGILKPGIL